MALLLPLRVWPDTKMAEGEAEVFRVSTVRNEKGRGTVLKLEGRLADAWVDELQRAAAAAMDGAAPVILDLDGLSFVDARGVALLRGTAERGARLVGGSPFVTTLISQREHHDVISG